MSDIVEVMGRALAKARVDDKTQLGVLAERVLAALEAAGYAVVPKEKDESRLREFIEIEKRLCAILGRKWAPSGFSIETLLIDINAKMHPAADTAGPTRRGEE